MIKINLKAKNIVLSIALLGLGIAGLAGYFNLKGLSTLPEDSFFKIGHCYRDSELGVLYKITHAYKGEIFAVIMKSEKYPSTKPIGGKEHWPAQGSSSLVNASCP